MEAVHLRGGGRKESTAAATIGVQVLEAAGRQVDDAEAVGRRWAARLVDLPFSASGDGVRRSGKTTEVAL